MKKSFKYRLFPNKKQQRLLQKQLDTCRWLYNHFLKERKNFWENDKISIKRSQQYKSLLNILSLGLQTLGFSAPRSLRIYSGE